MRYLNKIVFINSATVPYAEIQLDGNIHFIGTQGVGKSTILRAILYFYNADSRKLGIPKGPTVKSFADWYLGYANSYLIYEVARETGAYCVMAFKSQNRVSYRFIDTPYQSKYFISKSGNAYGSWGDIRQQLDADRVNVSSIVNSYDQYRDILYGNFTGKREFVKYALLEAKQYRNIYRTIQNVFLNTKLDANEIKQTIISSMEDEQIEIDLDKYNRHLGGFEKDLNDIQHFKKPSVQRQATNAVEILSILREIDREQKELVAHLSYRLEQIEQQQPELQEQKEQQHRKLNTEEQKLSHEQQLFEKRKDKINEQVNQLSGKIKESTKQKRHYESINIDELIKRVGQNEEKRLELESLKQERQLLTNKYSSINNKYDALLKEEELKLIGFKSQKEAQKLEIEKQEVVAVTNLNTEYEKLFRKLELEHEEELNLKQQKLSLANEHHHKLDKQKLRIKHTTLYTDELKQIKENIDQSNFKLKQTTLETGNFEQQIETLQTKWNYEKNSSEQNSAREKEQIKAKLNNTQEKKNDIEQRIEKSKDSLYGWLNQNKPGWEKSIGKIIDTKVLFSDGLSPQLSSTSESLFGIQIDLEEIELNVKTIDDYQFELNRLNEQIAKSEKELSQHDTKLDKELEKIQKRNAPKIKTLKEQIRTAKYQCEQLVRQIEKLNLEHTTLSEKAKTEKQQQIATIQQQIDKAIVQKEDADKLLKESRNLLRKNIENKRKEKTRRINELNQERTQQVGLIDIQIAEKSNQITERITTIKKERNDELNNKGANTNRLTEVERLITTVENELQFIERNRSKVSDYQKDKRELFDKEKEFKNEIGILEKRLSHQKDEFLNLRNTQLKLIEQIKQAIATIEKHIDDFATDLKRYDDFCKSAVYDVIQRYDEIVEAIETPLNATKLIDRITEKFYLTLDKRNDLKMHIDKFLSNFSEVNIFKFPVKLFEIDEYIHWAEELSDFIEEEKIVEFEKRTNERFAYIISSVGKETTLLISKTGEIKKTINKINADFRQKNFVAAINNIELDITDSKNSAVMLLRKIKDFNDDNAFNLGSSNLFSGTDHGKNNAKAVELLKQLIKEIGQSKDSVIQLTDSFELAFRVEENGNDTGWVEKLTNVGSEGTDVLVKAMINIMLLNVFKEGASRRFKDFKLHCMMDEIGKLHPNNVKGILNFANDRNILLINGSPTESTPLNYRHIYKISKDSKKQAILKRIISNPIQ